MNELEDVNNKHKQPYSRTADQAIKDNANVITGFLASNVAANYYDNS
jgi:hypothetical protein